MTAGPSGKYAYVVNESSNRVSIYSIDPNTGILTQQGTAPAGTLPVAAAVDPSGRFAYVANQGSNNVSMYAINANTEALPSPETTAPRPGHLPLTLNPPGTI